MNPVTILNFFVSFFPWGYVKLAILILLAMYIIFAAVIVRQGQLMEKVIEVPSSPLLRIVSMVHFLTAVGIFLLTFLLI